MHDYAFLDSGGNEKLERFGPHTLVRPAPGAFWRPALPAGEWKKADAHYHRSSKGGGSWQERVKLPPQWSVQVSDLLFLLKPTPFGHLGIFPEQAANWTWITQQCERAGRQLSVLNLFAYTGGSTLAAAKGGAKVAHCDSSKGIVQWASENARANALGDAPIRWIVEDALRFVEREVRRGSTYDGIILDPPSFGRGANGEVFKIEDDLPILLQNLQKLLSRTPAFMVLTSHSPGFTAESYRNLLLDLARERGGSVDAFELGLSATSDGRTLPAGSCGRWSAG